MHAQAQPIWESLVIGESSMSTDHLSNRSAVLRLRGQSKNCRAAQRQEGFARTRARTSFTLDRSVRVRTLERTRKNPRAAPPRRGDARDRIHESRRRDVQAAAY